MGIGIAELIRLFDQPRLAIRPLKMLDIGSQNIHGADSDSIRSFIKKHNDVWREDDLQAYAELLSQGAFRHPSLGGTNGAWLGDLVERIGVEYLAFDIFNGYKTEIFDLNEWALPQKYHGVFDIVINCGTTEHVLNQMNSFRVIHDATKVGGLMYHSLPMTGFLDHGYFNYNPRLFWELAQANGYRVIKLRYNGPGAGESVIDQLVRPYAGRIAIDEASSLEVAWSDRSVPTASLSVLLEKTANRPFRASLEISTTVGEVAGSVGADSAAVGEVLAMEAALMKRLDDPALKPQAISAVFQRHQELVPHKRFPIELERRVLQLYLRDMPHRADLAARLKVVEKEMLAETPLLGIPVDTQNVDQNLIAMDGREQDIIGLTPPARRFAHAVAAYHSYAAASRLPEFPPELEKLALDYALALDENDGHLLVRRGRILSNLTPKVLMRRR